MGDASQSELLPAQFLRRASDERVSEGREAMGGAQVKMTAVLPPAGEGGPCDGYSTEKVLVPDIPTPILLLSP